MREMEYLEELTGRYPVLHAVKADVLAAYEMMRECYEHGGKVLIAGNGGSCADSEHIVGAVSYTHLLDLYRQHVQRT